MYIITALPTDTVTALREGGLDAFGNPPEHHISDGDGNPCRHCLRNISKGAGMLVLAYKPFEGTHPYAEIGPIFLCADACPRGGGADLPQILRTSPDYLIKGYGPDDRIVYGTGMICPSRDLAARFGATLADPRVAYIHVRSARNTCYQARVDKRA